MSEGPTRESATPSTTLQLGDRTIVVEAAPLAKSPRTRLGVVTAQPRCNRLLLKELLPWPLRWGLAFVLFIVAAPLIMLAAAFVLEDLGGAGLSPIARSLLAFFIVCLLGCFIVGAFVLLLGWRPPVEFEGQQARRRFFGLRRLRGVPGRILAIQLLPGRVDEEVRQPWPGLQLNLILDDPQQPRVGFITFRDADWTREAARKLADHLGVPLIDQIPAGLPGSE